MGSIVKRELKPQQKKVCELFVINFNLAEAWLGAGYKCKDETVALSSASRFMLSNVEAQAYIERLLAEQKDRAEKTADDIIREVERIGFSNIEDFVGSEDGKFTFKDWKRLSRGQLAAVESVKVSTTTTGSGDDKRETQHVQFKLCSKLSALEDLAKRYELFADKLKVEHDVTLADIAARARSRRRVESTTAKSSNKECAVDAETEPTGDSDPHKQAENAGESGEKVKEN